jgi:Domain of unknown function (DUF6458)
MGFGVNLVLITIGAILAFATHFTLSGVDIRMVGWILMVVGAAGMLISFAYIRPRRRAGVVEVDGTESAYDVQPDEDPVYVVPERASRRRLLRASPAPHTPDDEPADAAPHLRR